MNQKNVLSVRLTRAESIAGWIYLPCYLLLLSLLLGFVLALLGYDLNSSVAQARINLLYGLINFIAIAIIFHRFLIANLSNIPRRFWGFLQAIILGFALYWAATAAINGLLQWLYPGLRNANNDSITTMAGVDYRAMLLYTVALAPVTEESLFRGLIFSSIHKKHRILAYAVSALAFAALHIVGYLGTVPAWQLGLSLLQYLPAGIALAWVYERAVSIWASIVLHMAINALSMLALQAM